MRGLTLISSTVAFATFAMLATMALAQTPAADKQPDPEAKPAPATPASGTPTATGPVQPAADPPPMPTTTTTTATPMTPPETTTADRVAPPAGNPRAEAHAKMNIQAQCEQAIVADPEWHTRLKGQLARRLLTEEPTTKPDKVLRAQLKDMLRPEIHTKDANRMLRNKRHVVYAYAALWIITAVFVLFMWRRQRGLTDEIARLRSEIEAELK